MVVQRDSVTRPCLEGPRRGQNTNCTGLAPIVGQVQESHRDQKHRREISLPEYDIGERMTQSKRRAESRDVGQAGAISPPGRRQAARPRSPGLPADGGVAFLRAAPCYMTWGYFPWGIPEEKERHAGKEPPPPMANPGRRTPRARRAARARHPSRRTCPRGKKDARHSERLPAFAHLCF